MKTAIYLILFSFICTTFVSCVPINEEESICSICLSEIGSFEEESVKSEEIVQLDCSHSFHRDCLISWFRADRAETGRMCNCPTCRHPVPLTFIGKVNIDPDSDLNLFNSTLNALLSTHHEIKVLLHEYMKEFAAWNALLEAVDMFSDEDIQRLEEIYKRIQFLKTLEKKALKATQNPKFAYYFDDDDDDDDRLIFNI